VRRGSRAALALAAAALLLGGCGGGGGGQSEAKKVETAVIDWAHAFGAGDGDKACSLLTPGARDAFTKRIATLVGTTDCAEAIKKLPAVAGPNVTGPFQDATVNSVRVSGDRATARLMAGSGNALVTLEKSDGDWLLTRVPGTQ
jgi:hypothetical protein